MARKIKTRKKRQDQDPRDKASRTASWKRTPLLQRETKIAGNMHSICLMRMGIRSSNSVVAQRVSRNKHNIRRSRHFLHNFEAAWTCWTRNYQQEDCELLHTDLGNLPKEFSSEANVWSGRILKKEIRMRTLVFQENNVTFVNPSRHKKAARNTLRSRDNYPSNLVCARLQGET